LRLEGNECMFDLEEKREKDYDKHKWMQLKQKIERERYIFFFKTY